MALIIILVIILFLLTMNCIDLSGKITKLSCQVKKFNNLIMGENKMSDMLKNLEGKMCKINIEGYIANPIECKVINVDNDWMEINYIKKSGKEQTEIIRINDINNISLL